MNNNQKLTITLIATIATLIGVLVGILAYFRKKAAEFDDSWDCSLAYDGFDDDFDDFDDYDCCCGDDDCCDFDESILTEENSNA